MQLVRLVIKEARELKDWNATDRKKIEVLSKQVEVHTNSEKDHSYNLRGHVVSGKSTFTWRLIFELEKLKQEAERLTKGSFVFAFCSMCLMRACPAQPQCPASSVPLSPSDWFQLWCLNCRLVEVEESPTLPRNWYPSISSTRKTRSMHTAKHEFQGLPPEHLARDSAAEQDHAHDQGELGEEVLGNVCGDCGEEG